MENLPKTQALYCSASVDEVVANIRLALSLTNDMTIKESAKRLAAEYDWKVFAEEIGRHLNDQQELRNGAEV